MAEKVVGTPVVAQEHRETLSVTIDVLTGMTDFVVKKTLINADTKEVITVQKIREIQPTGDVKTEITEAVTASADVKQPEVEPVE